MISLSEIRIVLFHLRKLSFAFFLVIALMLVMALLEGFGLGMLLPIINSIQNNQGAPGSDIFSRYTEIILLFLNLKYSFLNLIIVFSGFMLVKFGIQACLDYRTRDLSSSLKHHLRRESLGRAIQLPMSYFDRRQRGDIVSTIYYSSDMAGSIAEYGTTLICSLLIVGVYIGLEVMISPPLTLICFVLTGFSYWFILPRFKSTFRKGEAQKELIDKMVSSLTQTLEGIRVIKAFKREKKHLDEFVETSAAFRKNSLALMMDKVVAHLFSEPYGTVLIIVMMIVSVKVLNLEFASLITFFVIFIRLAPRLKQINGQYLSLLEYLPHIRKVHEIITFPAEEGVQDGENKVTSIGGGIKFNDVWYRYEERGEYVLKGVDFEIKCGEVSALVGPSGGGKSTIVDLLLKNLFPGRGVIEVGGRLLHDLETESWLGLIGFVEQEPFLFYGTITENIRYGKLEASQEEMEMAAQLANAHGFIISTMPEKYDTQIGDRGVTLSGGEKQRIALARALIRKPLFLILDEATSSLDSENERFIQESIENLRRTTTILVIAHRLSTVINADNILLLDDGRVAESGRHEELLGHGGLYANNYHLQVGAENSEKTE